jgi:hypothetical protein
MYGRRKWLRHRGRRLCGLCSGEPAVGRPRGCTAGGGRAGPAREIRIPVAFTKLFQSGYDSNYRTTRQPQLSERQIHWPRGKTLGGSSSLMGRRGHVGIALTMTVGQNSAFLAACTELRPHRLGELNEPDGSAPSPVPSTAGCGTGPRMGTCVPSGGDQPDRSPGAYPS